MSLLFFFSRPESNFAPGSNQDPKIMDEVENGTVEQQLLLYLKNKLIEKIEMRSDY